MTRLLNEQKYSDMYEYHGNNCIAVIRKRSGQIIWRDWLVFNSIEEAQTYFETFC